MADDKKENSDEGEEGGDEISGGDGGGGGNLTSPEGILMLCIAALLDAIGMVIALAGTWFGIDDYGVLDILGMLIIGGWMLVRGGSSGAKEAAKKGLKRFITASAVEVVPFLGGVAPSWIILVYRTLKN